MNLPHLPELGDLRFFLKIYLPIAPGARAMALHDQPTIPELQEFDSSGLFSTKWLWSYENLQSDHGRITLLSPMLSLSADLSKRLDQASWFHAHYGVTGRFSRFQISWEVPKADQSGALDERAILNRFRSESNHLSVPAAEMQWLDSIQPHQMRVGLIDREWLAKLLGKTRSSEEILTPEEIRAALTASIGESRIEGLIKAYGRYQRITHDVHPGLPWREKGDIESSGLADYVSRTAKCSAFIEYRGAYSPEAMALAVLKQGAVVNVARDKIDQNTLQSMFRSIDAAIQVPAETAREYAQLKERETEARRITNRKRAAGARVETNQTNAPNPAAVAINDVRLNAANLFYVTFTVPFGSVEEARTGYATLAAIVDSESGAWQVSNEAPFSIQHWKLNPPASKLDEILENDRNRQFKFTLTTPLLRGHAGLQYLDQIFYELESSGLLNRCVWKLHSGREGTTSNEGIIWGQIRNLAAKLNDNVALVDQYIANEKHGMRLDGTFTSQVLPPSVLLSSRSSSVKSKAWTPDGDIRNIRRYYGFANADFNYPLMFIACPQVRSTREGLTTDDTTRAVWKLALYGRELAMHARDSWSRFGEMMETISNSASFEAAMAQVDQPRRIRPLELPSTPVLVKENAAQSYSHLVQIRHIECA